MQILDELDEVGTLRRELPDRTARVVVRARSENPPITWREIAARLEMTELGVRNIVKAFEARQVKGE